MLMGVIKDELTEIKEKYNDKRKTKIVADDAEMDEEDLVEQQQVAITITHLGYIKRIPADTYRTQKRGGKGVTGLTTRENDFVKDLIMTSTHDYLMFFTNTGKAHRLKAYEVPEAGRTAKGIPAVNFLSLMQRERISAVIPIRDFAEDKYLIAITKKGIIKRTALSNFNTNRKTGIIAMNLKDDDELISVKESNGDANVIIVTKYGKCICFSEDDVRIMGRIAGGVRAIKLEGDDEVVSMQLVKPDQKLLVVTENGFGKRTKASEYKIQVRGGKGLLTYDKSKFKKTGQLIGATVVDDDDEVFLINSEGIIIRIKASDVSVLGRATQGVKIMKVDDGEKLIAMARAIKDEDDEQVEAKPEKKKKTGEEQLSLI